MLFRSHHFAVLAVAGELSADKAIYNYIKAIGKGLSKIMSKMGVSTYMSYCGAQLFEAIGLNKPLIDKYFRGTPTQVGGIGVFEVAEEAIRNHKAAFGDDPVLANMLDAGGEYAWRTRGEEHMWTPDAIAKLQHSSRSGKFETYKEYAQIINDQNKRHMTLRGLFEFKIDPSKAIAIEEVELRQTNLRPPSVFIQRQSRLIKFLRCRYSPDSIANKVSSAN